jgi:nicotinate-nucleotide adenylyltransferase
VRVGIFGGSFDPIHIGHLVLAQVALEEARLDRVLFVPAAINPLKVGRDTTSGEHRYQMVRLAVEGHPQFAVSDWEVSRPGPSFTVETLEHLRAQMPQDELFFLIGADNLPILPRWKRIERIAELAVLLAFTRPGFDLKEATEHVVQECPALAGRMRYIEMPALEISSTWIRERLMKKLPVTHLLPASVIRYSEENRLYE